MSSKRLRQAIGRAGRAGRTSKKGRRMVRLDEEDDYYDDDDDEEEVGVRIRREAPMLRHVLAGTCLAVLLGVATVLPQV